MQSSWRVACVRIPRFPIGAGWREARVVPGVRDAHPADDDGVVDGVDLAELLARWGTCQ